jgi:hypothetical protein
MIQHKLGDLLWDDMRGIYGIITEKLSEEAGTWMVYWSDDRTNWVYSETILRWKKELEELKEKNDDPNSW